MSKHVFFVFICSINIIQRYAIVSLTTWWQLGWGPMREETFEEGWGADHASTMIANPPAPQCGLIPPEERKATLEDGPINTHKPHGVLVALNSEVIQDNQNSVQCICRRLGVRPSKLTQDFIASLFSLRRRRLRGREPKPEVRGTHGTASQRNLSPEIGSRRWINLLQLQLQLLSYKSTRHNQT